MADQSRVLRGRIGALVMHSRNDARATTAKARETFLARFEREVDPDGVLPPAERQRRAEFARRAHMARLAFRSAQSRAKAREKATAPVPSKAPAAAASDSVTEDLVDAITIDDVLAP